MRKRIKRMIWAIYRAEYRLFNDDKDPSPRISLCKLSWSIIGLGFAVSLVAILIATVSVLTFLFAFFAWFAGFSPTPLKWIKDSENISFWANKEKGYYKVDKKIAPWEVVFFPVSIVVWIVKSIVTSHAAFLIFVSAPLSVLLWTLRIVSWLPGKAVGTVRGTHCPFPLDFSDVATPPKET